MNSIYKPLATDDGPDASAECSCVECRCETSGHSNCSCPPVLRPFLYFHVEGMHCKSCVFRIEFNLKEKPGISSAEVDLNTKQLRVGCMQRRDPSAVEQVVTDVVQDLGFTISPQAYQYTIIIPPSDSLFRAAACLSSEMADYGWRSTQYMVQDNEVMLQLCKTPNPDATKQDICQVLAAAGVHVGIPDIAETAQSFLHVVEPSPPMCCGKGFSAILHYDIDGMQTPNCASNVELTLREKEGVIGCDVDFVEQHLKVTLAPEKEARAMRPILEAALQEMGYKCGLARIYTFFFAARSGPSGWRTALLAALRDRFPRCTITGQTVSVTIPKLETGLEETCSILIDIAQGLKVNLRPTQVHIEDSSLELSRESHGKTGGGCCAASPRRSSCSKSTAVGCSAEVVQVEPLAIGTPEVAQFLVQGMSCASCSAKIEAVLGRTSGIQQAVVNFATMTAKVRYFPTAITSPQIKVIISDLGYGAEEVAAGVASREQFSETLKRKKEIQFYLFQFLFSCLFTLPLLFFMIFGMWAKVDAIMDVLHHPFPGLHGVDLWSALQFFLSTPVVLLCGLGFYKEAWNAVRHGSTNMQVLITLGVQAAYIGSLVFLILIIADKMAPMDLFFAEGSTLITFMLLGRLLESFAKKKTSEALLTLLDLQPMKTIRLDTVQGKQVEEEVDVEFITKGDVMKVMAGDRIPVDGKLVFGVTTVDESMITGESVPIRKKEGDDVIGGTINMEGLVHVEATKLGDETMLAQILKSVHDAQTSKAPIQIYADKVAGVFVPIVIIISLVSLVIWMTCGYLEVYPADWYGDDSVAIFALRFFIASLVVACPCAMGLATPTAVMVGSGMGARNGLLIKGGEPLETLSKVTSILFDKTGTLTQGNVEVAEAQLLSNLPEQDIWRMVGEAETNSLHPVAQAVSRYCAKKTDTSLFTSPAGMFTIPGRGVQCTSTLNGTTVTIQVGSAAYISEMFTIPEEVANIITRYQQAAMTVVLAGLQPVDQSSVGSTLIALFALSDALKPEAVEVIRILTQHLKLDVRMVSGDHKLAAEAIAAQLHLPKTHVHSEVLPQDKAVYVAQRRAAGRCVAFVGDGINDAPALARADVGVALGAGTQVAMDCADVVLLRNNLADIVSMLSLARATVLRIRLNFVWAFGYNIIALPIAAGVMYPLTHTQIPPIAAGVAMVASSLTVLLCSLSLRLWRKPKEVRHL